MLKALHLRVFFWKIANSWYSQWFMLDELTAKAAASYWQAARNEHQLLVNYKSTETPEPLPEHLAQLLDMEFDDDLHQVIVQRAYNLAWNKASAEDTDPDEGMDGVVEDFAVRSPLDAVAAWWSCWVLRKALMRYLDGEKAEDVEKDIDAAVRTAPPGSEAQTRAM
ncbi:Clr6 histone deacetylase associated PHD protein-2 Cph2, partial [Cryomyces antarcticus]